MNLIAIVSACALSLLCFTQTLPTADQELPFDVIGVQARDLAGHLNDQLDMMVRTQASQTGGGDGKGRAEYLGAGPWGDGEGPARFGAIAFYYRVHARAKVDRDIATNPVKIWGVDTVQVIALLVVPKFADDKITFEYDGRVVSERHSAERAATTGQANEFGNGIGKSVIAEFKKVAPKKIELPAALSGLNKVASLAVTRTGLTVITGPSASGFAKANFSPSDQHVPEGGVLTGYEALSDRLISLGKDGLGFVQFFGQKGCSTLLGEMNVADMPQGQCVDLANLVDTTNRTLGHIKDRVRSVRWRLPADSVVRLINEDKCLGNQVNLVGEGEIRDLGKCDFNDNLSRLKWDRATGSAGAANTVSLYWKEKRNSDKKHPPLSFSVSQVQSYQAIAVTSLSGGSGWDNGAASLSWDLAAGVIVILTQEVDGSGRNLALIGSGVIDNLNDVSLKEKISAVIVLP